MKLKPITPPDIGALKLRAAGILARLGAEMHQTLSEELMSAGNKTASAASFTEQQSLLDDLHAVTLAIRIVKGEVTLDGNEIPQAPAIPKAIEPRFELEDQIKRIVTEGHEGAVGKDQVRVQRIGEPR